MDALLGADALGLVAFMAEGLWVGRRHEGLVVVLGLEIVVRLVFHLLFQKVLTKDLGVIHLCRLGLGAVLVGLLLGKLVLWDLLLRHFVLIIWSLLLDVLLEIILLLRILCPLSLLIQVFHASSVLMVVCILLGG